MTRKCVFKSSSLRMFLLSQKTLKTRGREIREILKCVCRCDVKLTNLHLKEVSQSDEKGNEKNNNKNKGP